MKHGVSAEAQQVKNLTVVARWPQRCRFDPWPGAVGSRIRHGRSCGSDSVLGPGISMSRVRKRKKKKKKKGHKKKKRGKKEHETLTY